MTNKARKRPSRRAVQPARSDRRKKIVKPRVTPKLPFDKINLVFLWTGIVMAVISFGLLAMRYAVASIVFSVFGYIIFISVGLIYTKKRPPNIQKEKIKEDGINKAVRKPINNE